MHIFKKTLFGLTAFFVCSMLVFAEVESTFNLFEDDEEASTYSIPSDTNYVVLENQDDVLAVWTNKELDEDEKLELIDLIDDNEVAYDDEDVLFYYNYGNITISDWGTWSFELDGDSLKITPPESDVSLIGYGKYRGLMFGNLVIKNLYKLNDGEKENPTNSAKYTITLKDTVKDGKYGDVEFLNNKASFTLKDSEFVSIFGLPAGTRYVITLDNSDIKLTDSNNIESVIEDSKTVVAAFTFQKELDSKSDSKTPVSNPPTSDYVLLSFGLAILSLLAIRFFNKEKDA